VLALGTSFGFASVAAAFFAWLLPDWLGWGVAAFAASLVYLVITAFEFVLARGVRSLTGRERLEER
jgi:hypothetical protein